MAAPPARARADYDYLIKLLLIGDSGNLSASVCAHLIYSIGNVLVFHVKLESLIEVWARVAFSCVSQMVPSQLALSLPLGVIDFKIRTIELDGKRIKLQIWDTAGQERFRTITTGMFLFCRYCFLRDRNGEDISESTLRNILSNLYRCEWLTLASGKPRGLMHELQLAYYRGAMGILLVYDVTDESSFNNIRNWIRNIEQHASDNVNKILVGNKADMDESKRAVPKSKGQALADEYGIKFFETSAKTNQNVEEVFFSIARDIKQRLSDTDTRAEPATSKIHLDQASGAGPAAQKSACCGS
ncbi:hypothetical protein DKX38_013761 [Salix brachista]|uniref:Uncharacterized protein n=1 Tax=Salix brachista TaxID=2182728 RepID=A0A5N5LDM6_9ROSI|nr:hypothetical protein DKX38_013761 [Salix brachista]